LNPNIDLDHFFVPSHPLRDGNPAPRKLGSRLFGKSVMVASVWLQPIGGEREVLRDLIARLAAEHGTMPFEPHLTVCTIPDPTPQAAQAAADYIAACRTLPLAVRRTAIHYSPIAPLRALTIAIENTAELRGFRERLRQLTGANELVEPHISLLYAIGHDQRRVAWAGDADRLGALAADCERRLAASRFRLDEPILVAPDGEWTNIASWTTIRRF
jgi:2'-5' RNA ligase